MKLLVLLIGGNPIANYALIKFFKDYESKGENGLFKYDKVVLIYTKQTQELSENIKKLNKDIEFIDINLKDKARDINSVKDKVKNKLDELGNISAVHLNYTGGTKPMSVGTFSAIEEFGLSNVNKIFSDISPANYKLYLRRGEEFPKDGNIAQGVNVSIEEFCLLHGANVKKLDKKNSEFYNKQFIEYLLDTVKKDESFVEFWKNDFKNLKEENWKDGLQYIDLEQISNKKLKKLQKFIKGIFLEEYIFDILYAIKDELKFTDLAWNVIIENKRKKEFELDIVVTKGYTIYVISCTTDKKAHIKQKAFEASIRAEQIGGIGAKPILVSFADKETVDKTKDEMVNYAGKNSFEILGFEDIRDIEKLKDNIKNIFVG
jgi:hypothetical protein